jgi:flagellum-specific ATP synthase
VSRLATEITSPAVQSAAAALRETLAAYRAKEDLITIGAYSPGADPGVDYAIAKVPEIDAFLRQPAAEAADATETDLRLMELMADRDTAPQPVQNIEPANAVATFATQGVDYVDTNRLLEA